MVLFIFTVLSEHLYIGKANDIFKIKGYSKVVSVLWNIHPYTFFCFCADADNVKLKLMKLLSLSPWLEHQWCQTTNNSSCGLRVVPHFSSGIVERAKRERAWKSPHARQSDTRVSPFLAWGDFHASSRFARSTIPEEKWGTTRSLQFLLAGLIHLRKRFQEG